MSHPEPAQPTAPRPGLQHPGRWIWLVLLIPIAIGVARLRLDVEIFNLLPPQLPAVQGLKLHQEHFANARELILTLKGADPQTVETAARAIAERLRPETNLIESVTWEPPWLEHPDQSSELMAYLWLNQSPEQFRKLADRLVPERLAETLSAAREELATTLSPQEIARLSYDPLGLTRLPEAAAGTAPSFEQGQEAFASPDGTFRILYVQARPSLRTYRECELWLGEIRQRANSVVAGLNPSESRVTPAYTGRPAFVAEIARGMANDINISVGGTAGIIALLFWLAHRRMKPMLWLLALLALILGGTLALGGLVFGTLNVISMGFAAILLGLAVDYAVVHYQEALAHPTLSIPQIRHAIAPSILWAAVTTIAAFLVLNFGGLPGLAQLGTLVGLGVALAAFVMIFEYLPPLFPNRRAQQPAPPANAQADLSSPSGVNGNSASGVMTQSRRPERGHSCPPNTPERAKRTEMSALPHSTEGMASDQPSSRAGRGSSANKYGARLSLAISAAVVVGSIAVLSTGLPRIDSSADALRPRKSPAYATLAELQAQIGKGRDPLWVVVSGENVSQVAQRLDAVEAALARGVSNQAIAGFTLPTPLWPRPECQAANRATAQELAARRGLFHDAARQGGFAERSMALTDGILDTWQSAAKTNGVFWPGNPMSRWIFDKFAARSPTNAFALGLVTPLSDAKLARAGTVRIEAELPSEGVWLSGWELLGNSIFERVKGSFWKVLGPMVLLVLLSLYMAFRKPADIALGAGVLVLSGLCLLSVMRLAGWSWNLMNLMAIPLVLGTGVDYSIFMLLALRRFGGDTALAYRSVGRALLLCGGTAVAGFGSLAWSGNAGMASLGKVCAVGIASNMLIGIFLLPAWWLRTRKSPARTEGPEQPSTPSCLYGYHLWRAGLWMARCLPYRLCAGLSVGFATIYWLMAHRRREVVVQNVLPAVGGDLAQARRKTKSLFQEFAIKLVQLWRCEAGLPIDKLTGATSGFEHFVKAHERNRGVLLLTVHLGNWEFGGQLVTRQGIPLQVLTMPEPGAKFTELRRASRARWNIETLVIGDNPLAFVEVIRRLESGAVVALLVDRPPTPTAVPVTLFNRTFPASIAAAELARASGCALVPSYLVRNGDGFDARILPEITYDRATLRDRQARQALTQEIMTAFEPVIQKHINQWYHFVPRWPDSNAAGCKPATPLA